MAHCRNGDNNMSVKTMNKKNLIIITKLVLIGLLTSTGCILNTLNDSGNMMPANGYPKKSSSPDPKITPTIQPLPLLSETPLITPTPTLDYLFMPKKGPSFEQQVRLFEALKDNNCELPCYLGITPGQTTWQEAKLKLESYGNVFYGPDRSEKSLAYDFRMVFLGSHVIILNIEDNIVQRIFLSIINHDESMYYDNWSKYSIHHTLIQLGAPDDIFINANEDGGYSIAMVYKKSGMALEWYGMQKKKRGNLPRFQIGRYIWPKFFNYQPGLVIRYLWVAKRSG